MTIFQFSIECVFEALSSDECPENMRNTKIKVDGKEMYLKNRECQMDMAPEDLCEADKALPDGSYERYDINNCGPYDVFRCKGETEGILRYRVYHDYDISMNLLNKCENVQI